MSPIPTMLVLVLTSAIVACQAAPTPTPPPATAPSESAVVTADGILQPVQSASLDFTIGGRVTEVNAQVGDQVKQGDALAKLDDTATQKQIAQAETAAALAQKEYDQLESGATAAERAAAQAALEAAQQNYDRVRAGPTAEQLAQLKAQMENARALRDQAQAAYDRIGGATNPYIAMTPESAQLEQAINNYNAASAAYDEATQHPTPAELAVAKAQLDQAQAAVARLTPTQDELDIAQLKLKNAQAALESVQANAAEYVLTAPFDGTIGEKSIAVGDVVGPGDPTPAFTLGDVSRLRLETTNLAQEDAPRVKVGQSATVTLDAFPGKTFPGQVARIAPAATVNRGDRVFMVWIEFDGGTPAGLRWGMSGTVHITVE